MKTLHLGAALLSILAASPAVAEDAAQTTLTSPNGSVVLVGVLRAADSDSYTLETGVGLLTIKRTASVCSGFCPTELLASMPMTDGKLPAGQDS